MTSTLWWSLQVNGRGWLEVALIGLHYAWLAAASLTALAPAKALLYFLVSQLICGVLLGIVFVQSHNGMTVYNAPTDFVTAQVISTRDILSSAWTDWFTGSGCPAVLHIFVDKQKLKLLIAAFLI